MPSAVAPLRFPVFTPAEAASTVERVDAAQEEWIARGPDAWTLGRAAYADGPRRTYFPNIAASNAVLQRTIGDQIEAVRAALADFLGERVRFDAALALPGVHIFATERLVALQSGTLATHFDQQDRFINTPAELAKGEMISITVPVLLPAAGGGLEIWPVAQHDVRRDTRHRDALAVDWIVAEQRSTVHLYEVGVAVLQQVPQLHRIARIDRVEPEDRRLSVQAHAFWEDGGWTLYW